MSLALAFSIGKLFIRMDKNTSCLYIEVGPTYSSIKLPKILFSTLKTKGAVREIGGAEFKLSTQQCLTPFLPPPHPLSLLLLRSVLAGCQRTHRLFWTPTPGTPQRSNLEQLPAMKYLPHRRDIFSREAGTKVQHERQTEYERRWGSFWSWNPVLSPMKLQRNMTPQLASHWIT